MPLVTTASGTKFGKTEAGTVWLDPALTSPFRFYQFWLNADDRDVVPYLKFFTFLPREEIEVLEAATREAPERRAAQRRLAREVTLLVHGADAVARAERASGVLFGGHMEGMTADEVLAIFDDVPSTDVPRDRLAADGLPLVQVLADVKLTVSRSEATRLVRGGGVYVNNQRVTDERARLTLDQAVGGQLFVLRKGSRDRHLLRLVG
jgi:tyrosyl-tRNA synthetase